MKERTQLQEAVARVDDLLKQDCIFLDSVSDAMMYDRYDKAMKSVMALVDAIEAYEAAVAEFIDDCTIEVINT